MLGFLGGLAGGVSSLLGGIFGQRNQQEINQQNINEANYLASNRIQMTVADAKAAGINPLAALGSSFSPSAPAAVGSNAIPEAMSSAGQDVSRAAQAWQDANSKSAQLDLQLKQKQLEAADADITGKQLSNSRLARTFASPGSPPTVNVPLPRSAPHSVDTLPLFQDYRDRSGNRVTLFDPEAQRSIFSGVPGAVTYPELAARLGIENMRGPTVPEVLRPDVSRMLFNLPSSGSFDPSVWQQ